MLHEDDYRWGASCFRQSPLRSHRGNTKAAFREVTGLPLTRLRGEVDFRRPSIHEQSMAKFHMFQDVLVIVVAPSAVVFLVMSGHAVGQTQDRAILP